MTIAELMRELELLPKHLPVRLLHDVLLDDEDADYEIKESVSLDAERVVFQGNCVQIES